QDRNRRPAPHRRRPVVRMGGRAPRRAIGRTSPHARRRLKEPLRDADWHQRTRNASPGSTDGDRATAWHRAAPHSEPPAGPRDISPLTFNETQPTPSGRHGRSVLRWTRDAIARVTFDMQTALTPKRVPAILTGFSKRRPELWPTLAPELFESWSYCSWGTATPLPNPMSGPTGSRS